MLNDAISESDETFALEITGIVASGTDSGGGAAAVSTTFPFTTAGTITNDDYVITLATTDLTIKENETESPTWVLHEPMSTPSISTVLGADTVTVNYATVAGTASAGSDFNAASGTLIFTGSTVTQIIPVTIINDATYEAPPDKSFLGEPLVTQWQRDNNR